jgi:hypothetical protein
MDFWRDMVSVTCIRVKWIHHVGLMVFSNIRWWLSWMYWASRVQLGRRYRMLNGLLSSGRSWSPVRDQGAWCGDTVVGVIRL